MAPIGYIYYVNVLHKLDHFLLQNIQDIIFILL